MVGAYFVCNGYTYIIIYRDIYLDKLQKIILYPRVVLITFYGMTISVGSRKFDSDNMDFVEIEY